MLCQDLTSHKNVLLRARSDAKRRASTLIELLVVAGSALLFVVDANATGTLNVIEALSLNVFGAVGCQPPDCNDGNPCTNDSCVSGTCTHTPVACDTGLFCSAKVCDPLLGCVFDHGCFGSNGNPCPDPGTCDEVTNTCGGCNQPTAVGIACRYLAVTPADQGSTPVALLVIGDCGDPNASCVYSYVQSKCNGGANDGQDCLTDADCPKRCTSGTNIGNPCVTNGDCPLGTANACAGKCDGGTLGSTPFYKTASQWGTAMVRGAQIRPSADYFVETQCNFPEVVLSAAASARTWKWGDVDGNGTVDAIDIARLVDAFRGIFGPFAFEQMNLWPCTPDDIIDALDIAKDVDAFRGYAFPCGITDSPVDAPLQRLVDALSDMEEGLSETVSGSCGRLEADVPTPRGCAPDMPAVSTAALYENGELISSGNVTVTAHPTQGTADLVVKLREDGFRSWTLTQTIHLEGGAVRLWGTIERIQSLQDPTIRSGGWVYSTAGGAQEDPNSEPGFHDDASSMFHCSSAVAALSPAEILAQIGNLVQLVINYLLDLLIPYTPPTSCTGPAIQDGSGQSCDGVNVPCKNDLADACLGIDDLPDVSTPFKKCMKGRCGCGGSHFKKSVITCDSSDSCGPCGSGATGCNLAGTQIWYCDPTTAPCVCVNDVFHEMSHACGAPHNSRYYQERACNADDEPCRIGDWFDQQCAAGR